MSSGYLNISGINSENSFTINSLYGGSAEVSGLVEDQPIYFISNGNVVSGKYKSYATVGRGSNKKIVVTIESDFSPEIEHPFVIIFGEVNEEVNYEEFNTYLESLIGSDETFNSELNIFLEYVQQFIVHEPEGPVVLKQITGVISIDTINISDNTYTITSSSFNSSGGFSIKELTAGNELVILSSDSSDIKKYVKYVISEIITEGRGSNMIYYISFQSIDGYTPILKKGDSVLVVYSSENNFICLPVTSDGISNDVIIQARNQNLFDFDSIFIKKISDISKKIFQLKFELNNFKSSNLEYFDVLNKYINKELERLDLALENQNTRLTDLYSKLNLLTDDVRELFNSKLSGIDNTEVPETIENNTLYFVDAQSKITF